jgi:hypothetical protein
MRSVYTLRVLYFEGLSNNGSVSPGFSHVTWLAQPSHNLIGRWEVAREFSSPCEHLSRCTRSMV